MMELNRTKGISVYKQIYDILLGEIYSGLYEETSLLPSEKELCARFDVERNTVRKALQMLVDEKLIIKKPGYGTLLANGANFDEGLAPNSSVAKSVRKNILLITHEDYLRDNGEYFHFKLINSFEKSISEIGHNLIFRSVGMGNGFREIIKYTSPVAIIFDSYMHDGLYQEGLRAGIPCISINHYTPLMTSVVSNNFDGAHRVAKMLTEVGHRRIAVISGKPNYQTNIERMSGVQSLYMKKGIPMNELLVINGNWLFSSGMEAGKRILAMDESERPSAVFAFNDDMAYGCYNYFERAGVHMPEQMSIVGFDKSDQYNSIFPMLTTVDVNVDAMIEYACWILSGQLNRTAPGLCAKIQIDTTICDNGTIRTLHREGI